MVSSNLGTVDLTDLSTGHTDGAYGHDALNDWLDIATRPGSTEPITHSSAGTLTLDLDKVAGGHIKVITVSANITTLTLTNVTTGIPFMLLFIGNGSGSFTINMSGIRVNSSTTLNSAVAIGPSDALAVSVMKLPNSQYWAPGGLLVFGSTAGVSGITSVGTGAFNYNGSSVTSIAVPIHSGVVAGDFLQIVVQTQESTDPGAPNTPSGWTQRVTNTPSAGFIPRVTVFSKYASGSEAGTNQTITWGTACRPCGGSQAWRGVHASTPYDITNASSAQMGNGNPDPNSVTTLSANAAVVLYTAGNKAGGSSCTAPTTPGTYTKTLDQSALDRAVVLAHRVVSVAAAENPNAFGWTVDNHTVITDALKKA